MASPEAAFPPVERRDWLRVPPGLAPIEGGSVTSTPGFRAGGVAAGLKPSGAPDVGVLAADGPLRASSLVDTRSALPAAAVIRNRRHPPHGFRAVVVNSGTANAGTGATGVANAEAMAARVARAIGTDASAVAVSSTGTIGDQLDMPRIERGIDAALAALSPDGGADFARAICTTDDAPKAGGFRLAAAEATVTIGAAAKGAGMIRPDMATMLAYLTTDADVAPEALQRLTADAARRSFNRISVDGQMSPSDTVIVLASGAAGPLRSHDLDAFGDALATVMRWLAVQMVRDGEGADHVVRALVRGAADDGEAERVARGIADSPLVKTSVASGDLQPGRVVQAVGQALAGTRGPATDVRLAVDDVPLDGSRGPDAAEVTARREYDLAVELTRGSGEAEIWFSDLTHAYVSLNTDYRT